MGLSVLLVVDQDPVVLEASAAILIAASASTTRSSPSPLFVSALDALLH
jgi:hypothetical protein